MATTFDSTSCGGTALCTLLLSSRMPWSPFAKKVGQCMRVCMCVCVVCVYACMPVCVYACMRVCMGVCVYACMRVCLYACMAVCVYACMRVQKVEF